MPDIGLTPFGLAQGPAGSAGITQLVDGLQRDPVRRPGSAAGLRVIPLDTFHFLREISADSGDLRLHQRHHAGLRPRHRRRWAAIRRNCVDPAAAETYAFADGVHPTARGARHARPITRCRSWKRPRQIAVLPHSEAMVGRSRADRVGRAPAGKPAGDGMRWWGDVRGDFQRYGEATTTTAPARR